MTLIPWVAEDHSPKPRGWRFYDDHVRDEKGRFVSREDASAGVSAFGVEHEEVAKARKVDHKRGERAFGNAAATAGVVGGVAALGLNRGRANKIGSGVARFARKRADLSTARIPAMVSPKLIKGRAKYERVVRRSAESIDRNNDTREVTGRAVTGAGAAAAAGGGVWARRNFTPVDNRRKR